MTAPAITSVADAEALVQLVLSSAPIPEAMQPAVAVLREQVDAALAVVAYATTDPVLREQVDAALGVSRQATAVRQAHARIIALRALGPDATIAQMDAWIRINMPEVQIDEPPPGRRPVLRLIPGGRS